MNDKFKQFLIREGFDKSTTPSREAKVGPKIVINEQFTQFLINEGLDEGLWDSAKDTAKTAWNTTKDVGHQMNIGVPSALGNKKASQQYDYDQDKVGDASYAISEWEQNGGPKVQSGPNIGGENLHIQALQKIQQIVKSDQQKQYAQPAAAFLAAAKTQGSRSSQGQDTGVAGGKGNKVVGVLQQTVQALEAVYGNATATGDKAQGGGTLRATQRPETYD